MVNIFIAVFLFRLIIGVIEIAKASCPPYEPEQQEPKQIQTYEAGAVVFSPAKEEAKEQERLRKERERRQREKAQERKRTQQRELAQMDLDYYSEQLVRINSEAAKLEQQRTQETAQSIIDRLDRQIDKLNERAYQADRKRQIAYNKIYR